MGADLIVQRLTLVETAEDGSAVRLVVDDADGQSVGIVLTIENLTTLIMTLPTAASNAVKRLYNDPNMRITYPLTNFQIEISPGNSRILTVGTADGFSVSFNMFRFYSSMGRRRSASNC
jgi:hypothetical protein